MAEHFKRMLFGSMKKLCGTNEVLMFDMCFSVSGHRISYAKFVPETFADCELIVTLPRTHSVQVLKTRGILYASKLTRKYLRRRESIKLSVVCFGKSHSIRKHFGAGNKVISRYLKR